MKTYRDTHTEGERPGDDGGRYWSDEASKSRPPRIVDNYQRLREARKDLSQEPAEGLVHPLVADF